MSWTKRQLIEDAFGELALAGYDFDLTPEEMQSALRKLETMMATWVGLGIQLGYAFGGTPPTDLDQDSGLPLTAVGAAHLNLAIGIAAGKGKALAASTKANAKAAYDSVVLGVVKDQTMPQPYPRGTPAGAGNRRWRIGQQPFLVPDADDDTLTFLGG